jgi:uncharacterized membrane protein YciS (DUF1049 family)
MNNVLFVAQSTNDAAAGAAALAGGFAIFSLVCFIIGVILAITWIIFPFLVISRLNHIEYASRQILQELKATRTQLAETAKSPAPPLPIPKPANPSVQPREPLSPPSPKFGPSAFGDNPGISQ